ncbi:2,4-dienoyl-CoA reductase [Sporobacter termitidis DSM 10068]|uniref:2,4-dienoyl-CoA reductase n=1 Tax=Sporobacter termitidis DSM 10068 TaxID=1123282 RepID=A0A1M5YDY5_9FIRM|nr:FAD-dependent oxidoreductase [Sporobacter termitidis]SHI10162.1 2,4-dienoyl-CoA reductase [Sporobacter termitidis DSM 10068]
MKYKHLFEPIQLGKQLFRNRIFASPQDFPGLTSDRFLTKDGTAFYELKAQGGYASVCVGDFMVDSRAGHSHPFQLRGDDVRGKVSLTLTANAITRHGAVASAELNHAGINANVMAEREGFIYGFTDGVRPDGVPVRAMDEAWIERLIGLFASGAAFARQCGFNMVTIHGGHGWLFSQFMSPRDNKRTDRWGGTFENRMRFPLSAIEAIRKAVGPGFPVEIRLSGAEYLGDDGYDLDYGTAIAKALDGKVDLIHVSAGHHEIDAASMVTHPSMFMPDGVNVHLAAEIKKHVKTPVATVGALTDPVMMEEIIASGQADVVALGRQTLADPNLPLKARAGREDEINRCLRCYNCFSYSTMGGVFYCATNPVIGNELESMFDIPPRKKKTVLVAGGGIGGMQAALTASERGHKVILCEKSGRLGGVLRCEAHIPFKKHLEEYLDLQARLISRSTVEVRLNTEVTPESVAALKPDVVIAALGSRPVAPRIPGIDGDNVFGAEDVYDRPELVGKRAVILGGGLVGLELGVYLAETGREVTVVELLPRTCASPDDKETSERFSAFGGMVVGDPLVHGIAIREYLKKLPNMTIRTSTKALEINDNGIAVEGPDGVQTIGADTIIYAVGQRPLREEAQALAAAAPEFHALGDCVTPRNIFSATQAAWSTARDIGRV